MSGSAWSAARSLRNGVASRLRLALALRRNDGWWQLGAMQPPMRIHEESARINSASVAMWCGATDAARMRPSVVVISPMGAAAGLRTAALRLASMPCGVVFIRYRVIALSRSPSSCQRRLTRPWLQPSLEDHSDMPLCGSVSASARRWRAALHVDKIRFFCFHIFCRFYFSGVACEFGLCRDPSTFCRSGVVKVLNVSQSGCE